MKTFLTLACAATLLAGHRAGAQTAREIVARGDSVRNPSTPFHATNAVVNYVGGKAHDRVDLIVYTKRNAADGAFANLVRYASPPRDAGKMVLFAGTNMWFYDPSSKTSVRISPQQRLIGLASNGDVVAVSLERDYASTLAGVDTLQDADRVRRVAWHLNLAAADRDAIYSRIELWIEQGTYRPIKGKYYSDSGRLLKIAYFHRYEEQLGAVRPGEIVIIDAVDPNLVTTMTLSDYVAQDIPDAWFQRDFLPRLSTASTGGEDEDLAALPPSVQNDTGRIPEAKTVRTHGRFFAEDAATATSVRSALVVPQPEPARALWRGRASADVTDHRQVGTVTLAASGRVNVVDTGAVGVTYDLREGYVAWEPRTRTYLEVGRINVHNGVALGFNPTDYFRARTLIDAASQDPSAVRDDRLGTLMVRAEHLWSRGEASVAFAPRLYAPTGITSNSTRPLALDRTNAADRVLATAAADVAGFAPELFVYRELGRTQVGVAVSRLLSQSVVAYAEYSGGAAASVVAQATRYARETGLAFAPVPLFADSAERFRSDVAAGASWTASAAKLTVNGEFHQHAAGFDRDDWRKWFASSEASPAAAAELWYVRAFANDQQQPMARRELFFRADRTDAGIRNLELNAFAFVDLADGSTLLQLAAHQVISDAWTLAGYVLANVGGARSEHGSLPQAGYVTAQLVRYF